MGAGTRKPVQWPCGRQVRMKNLLAEEGEPLKGSGGNDVWEEGTSLENALGLCMEF